MLLSKFRTYNSVPNLSPIKVLLTTAFILLIHFISAQIVEIEGKVKVTVMPEDTLVDSVVVRLPDKTLGTRSITDLPFVSTQNPFGAYYYLDQDTDGFGSLIQPVWVPDNVNPPTMFVSNSDDCNDQDSTIHPMAIEICDSLDNNCDGTIDNVPNMEICGDGMDNDCDGEIDEGCDPPKGDGSPCAQNTECISQICFAGYCGCNISGQYTVSPTIQYTCANSLVAVNISSMDVTSAQCSSISVTLTGLTTLTGNFNGADFTASSTIAGLCEVTYSMNGTFTTQSTISGTFEISFKENGAGACFDCTNQVFNFSGSK